VTDLGISWPHDERDRSGVVVSKCGLALNVDFTFEGDAWYAPMTGTLERLVLELPMWPELAIVKPGGPLDPASLAAAIRNLEARRWELLSSESDPEIAIECSHFENVLLFRLIVSGSAWHRYAGELAAIGWRFITGLRPGVVLPSSGIRPRFFPDLPWNRLPKRPIANFVRFDNVVDFFDPRLVALWTESGDGPVIERILAAAVPPIARRLEHEGVVMQSFTDALTDETALVTAREQHERWLVDRILAVGPAGDRQITVAAQTEAPPLSFVDPESRAGFKTVVVFPDGTREDTAWQVAVAVAAAGRIEPVGPLAGVYVIVPLREHAVALYAEAQNSGLAGVTYPDERGALWVITKEP
jgi:hypothetical protein